MSPKYSDSEIQKEINALEEILAETLRPVPTRPEYREVVKQHLIESSNTPPDPFSDRQLIFLGLAGLFASALIVIIGIRTTLSLLDALGMKERLRRPRNLFRFSI